MLKVIQPSLTQRQLRATEGEQMGRPGWGEGSDLPGSRCVPRLQGKVRKWSGRGNRVLAPSMEAPSMGGTT